MSLAGAGRAAVAVAALAAIATALVLLGRANAPAERARYQVGPTPVTVFRPADPRVAASAANRAAPAPLVVIAHGFAGSQQLMQPFAVTLARHGYVAVTFDWLGHGRNRAPLGGDVTRVDGATRRLVEQLGDVVDFAATLPGVGGRLALVGHSMASDVVVRAAMADPRVDATVAVSMFSPAVTAEDPRNLLVLVGEFEPALRAEALRAVGLAADGAEPGVTYGRFADGSARRAAFAPGVEHVGVLYSAAALAETRAWLDAVFGRDAPVEPHVDRRGGAIALLFAGLIVLAWPLSRLLPRVAAPRRGAALGWRALAPVALGPAVLTPVMLWPLPKDLLSVPVGGYLAAHFAVYGLATAALLGLQVRRGRAPAPAGPRDAGPVRIGALIAAIALATAYVAGVIGVALDRHVTAFVPTPERGLLSAAMLVGTALYFGAAEWATRGPGAARGGYAFMKLCFLLSLGIAVALSPGDLFFLLIIAVVILLYFVVYGFFSDWIYQATGYPLVGALACAIAFAWALSVTFPLLGGP